ncbi:RNA polymerase sigma factor [Flexithrix dorotheae]|uniref:RNA polymerase sigma factor n=1 Tax=Flexithrix dorotheae TaxID=70993 RepID=UPI000375E795|nr:sigma-70 family RNA polymerase sigma factor [Flexithrix dorotheae]
MKKDLLVQVKDGDISAYNELYHNFKMPAIKFCNSIINNWEESENLIQEVFIKIWEKKDSINPELNFNSYLFTIIRNRVYDYLKRIKRNEIIKEQYWQNVIEYQNSTEPDLKNERISLIKYAINGLTEKRKKIIHLNFEEGKSYEEIASMMNISKNTVKNQLVKAKHIIRAQTRCA